MRANPHDYAKAFLKSRRSPEDLLRTIRERGDAARAGKIVEAVTHALARERGGTMWTFEYANAKPAFPIGASDAAVWRKNPSLLAGARITRNGNEELDASFSQKLNKLFSHAYGI